MITQASLVNSARTWSQLAFSSYLTEDLSVALPAAGIAWEQLCKAALFAKHPTLLVELNNGKLDSLIGLLNLDSSPIRTINATEAFKRVQRIYRDRMSEYPPGPLDDLVAVRNGAVHVGLDGSTVDDGRVMEVFVRASNGLLDILEVEQDEYWGGDHYFTIKSMFKENLDEFERSIERKLAKARRRVLELIDRLPSDDFEMVAKSLQIRAAKSAENMGEQRKMGCPACDDMSASGVGRLVVDVQFGWRFQNCPTNDAADICEYERTWYVPSFLVCGVCEVRLNVGELETLGVDVGAVLERERLLGEPDVAVSDARR